MPGPLVGPEEIIDQLCRVLDEFPLTAVYTQFLPQAAMADWLVGGEAPAGFAMLAIP